MQRTISIFRAANESHPLLISQPSFPAHSVTESVAMTARYVVLTLGLLAGCARQSTQVPQTDTASVDKQGNIYVTRVIPMPQTISPEAQQYLLHPVSHPGPNATLAEVRAATDAMQAHDSAANRARYPVHIASASIAGVPVRIVTPAAPNPTA